VIIPDVNLLVYAVFTAFPQHSDARAWFEDTLNGPTRIALTGPAIFGFLRLSTSGRVFESPLSVDQAIAYLRDWLERPDVEYLHPGPRHLDLAFDLLTRIGTAGNLTTDVQLAAYAIEFDADLCSNDADFGRFPDVRWVNPLRGR
jgi:hypothetical protein